MAGCVRRTAGRRPAGSKTSTPAWATRRRPVRASNGIISRSSRKITQLSWALLVLEREVAVAGRADADLTDLALDPHVAQSGRPVDRLAHQLRQLGDGADRQLRACGDGERFSHGRSIGHRMSSASCRPGNRSSPAPSRPYSPDAVAPVLRRRLVTVGGHVFSVGGEQPSGHSASSSSVTSSASPSRIRASLPRSMRDDRRRVRRQVAEPTRVRAALHPERAVDPHAPDGRDVGPAIRPYRCDPVDGRFSQPLLRPRPRQDAVEVIRNAVAVLDERPVDAWLSARSIVMGLAYRRVILPAPRATGRICRPAERPGCASFAGLGAAESS